MRGRIAVGQGAVAGRGDHLLATHDHAADRDFAGFSGIFGRFQRQIHERRRGHASYHRNKPATEMRLQQKWIPVLRENAPRFSRARMHFDLSLASETRPFMPRDNDKDNDSRGRRDRPSGGKGRSGVLGDPRRNSPSAVLQAKRKASGAPMPASAMIADRAVTTALRHVRAVTGRIVTATRGRPCVSRTGNLATRNLTLREKVARSEPYAPRGEGFRKDGDRPRGDRPFKARPRGDDRPRGDRPFAGRPERKFDGDKKFSRGPRKDFGNRPDRDREFGRDRGDAKPWQKREDSAERPSRPAREGARNFDRPKFDKPRYDKPREGIANATRSRWRSSPRFSRPREDRPEGDRPFRERPKFDRPREDRPKFERPRRDRPEGRTDWQEHPRSEPRSRDFDRPRRDNEDDSKIFAKRPAFGGRGAYRERDSDERRPARPPKVKKSGERIAKVVSRAGLASRRDAEEWIVQGRVTVNGRVINSPALDVTDNDVITVDGKPLPPRERTRLFLYHKPRGSDDDPCRSRRAADGVRQFARRAAAADQRRPARFQHRGSVAADQ